MHKDAPPSADVRMHGFRQRSEVPAVLDWIDRHAARLSDETVPLDEAADRILATEVIAPLDVPAFDRAAMDGYALRGAETSGASEYNPLPLPVLGQALPGQPFAGSTRANAAIRIMTGAPMPEGLDAVVPAEYATETAGQLEITRPVAPGQHVGRRGEDIQEGSPVLGAGRRLRPQDVGLIASLGLAQLTVVQRPRVRILVTGNEVMAPGTPKGPYQIYDANSYMLRGLVARDGGVLESASSGSVTIRRRSAMRCIAPGADVILVSGGSSVGSEDHAPRLHRRDRASSPFTASRCGRRVPPASAGSARRSCFCCPAIRCPVFARTISSPAAPFGCAAGARRLAAPHPPGRCRPQDRLRDRPRRLLPRPPRRWPSRADRTERRVHPLVDDARRRLRDRSRGERGLRPRHRGHRVSVRVNAAATNACRTRARKAAEAESSQTQFLERHHARRSDRALPRAPAARAARQGDRAAAAAL